MKGIKMRRLSMSNVPKILRYENGRNAEFLERFEIDLEVGSFDQVLWILGAGIMILRDTERQSRDYSRAMREAMEEFVAEICARSSRAGAGAEGCLRSALATLSASAEDLSAIPDVHMNDIEEAVRIVEDFVRLAIKGKGEWVSPRDCEYLIKQDMESVA